MRVQCYLCEHEENGFCLKKGRGGKLLKIKTKKRRTCTSYSEEAVRVLTDFRKREAHRAALKNQELRRAQAQRAIMDAQAKAAPHTAKSEEEE